MSVPHNNYPLIWFKFSSGLISFLNTIYFNDDIGQVIPIKQSPPHPLASTVLSSTQRNQYSFKTNNFFSLFCVLNFITLLIIFIKLTDQNHFILKGKNFIKKEQLEKIWKIFIYREVLVFYYFSVTLSQDHINNFKHSLEINR